jgi:oxygen-independent coproporphyrinogen-3 oxidase
LERPDDGFSLYVHVPFCTDKCVYCDFYSVPCHTVADAIQETVVVETVRQARAALDAAPDGARVETIFIGGGTPSCLSPPLQEKLLTSFAGLGAREWTVEANPETLDEGFLSRCRDAGVNRLSVGIQTLHQDQLDLLRRRATREDCLRAIELLQSKWTGRLSLDFIAGIPGQTPENVREDLSVIERDWPSHVSLYQLTLEPGTPMDGLVEEGTLRLNRPETDEALWFEGMEVLLRRGYAHYEVSNFCRPGHECLHNIRYWNIEPYAGAGPAAVSTLPGAWAGRLLGRDDLSHHDVVRLSNPRSITTFLKRSASGWGATVERIESEDFFVETLMMGLRLSRGLSSSGLRARFGARIDEIIPGVWERWVSQGRAHPPSDRLRLTDDGLLLLDLLIGEVIDACAPWRGAQVVWP